MTQKSRVEQALATLTDEGKLFPGQTISVARLEELFGFERGSQELGWVISGLRNALYDHGLYLSGEGVTQTGFYSILEPLENQHIAKLAMARAERDLEGKQRLLINTRLDGLTELQRMRHDSVLHTLSLRLSAMRKVRESNEKTGARRKRLIEEPTDESGIP